MSIPIAFSSTLEIFGQPFMVDNSSQILGSHIDQQSSQPKVFSLLKDPKPLVESQNLILTDERDKNGFSKFPRVPSSATSLDLNPILLKLFGEKHQFKGLMFLIMRTR